jgi:hypothetical protein
VATWVVSVWSELPGGYNEVCKTCERFGIDRVQEEGGGGGGKPYQIWKVFVLFEPSTLHCLRFENYLVGVLQIAGFKIRNMACLMCN